MSRLLRLILLDSCCFLPKKWKLVETRSSQLSFNLALGDVCWIPILWIAGQIPMSQGLISPDYHGPPTCTLCSGRCRPSLSQTSCATDYNILRQVRVKMFRLKRNTEVPAATCCAARDLVTSWWVRCLLRPAFGSPEASPGLSRWRHEQWPEDPGRLSFCI